MSFSFFLQPAAIPVQMYPIYETLFIQPVLDCMYSSNTVKKIYSQTYGHTRHPQHTHTFLMWWMCFSWVVCSTTRLGPHTHTHWHTHAVCQEHDWHIWHRVFLSYTHTNNAMSHHQMQTVWQLMLLHSLAAHMKHFALSQTREICIFRNAVKTCLFQQ